MKSYREILAEADQKRVAIGHFNFSDITAARAVFESARALNVPILLGVSEGERDFVGVKQAVALVKSLRDEYDYPVYLNADHTYSFDRVKEAIDAGYDSVIFDGAKLSLDENIKITKQCVEYARASGRDVLVEGELGYIGTSSKILDEIPEGVELTKEAITQVDEADRYVRETGIDLFAPSVGNIHGMLRASKDPRLFIDRVGEIKQATNIPLVLHGGSGTEDEDFTAAIKAGITVVHINTEIRRAWQGAVKKHVDEHPDDVAPYKILGDALSAMSSVITERLKLFNHTK